MEDAPFPAMLISQNLKKEEEIIDSQKYKLVKDDKIYDITISLTKENLLIRSFSYENIFSKDDLTKLTKIVMENINEGYKFIKNIFDNGKVILKSIEINKVIKLQISIFDFKGNEQFLEIDLNYNPENKDLVIDELSMRANYLEEELTKLKNDVKDLKEQINEINNIKTEINDLKSFINEKEKEREKERIERKEREKEREEREKEREEKEKEREEKEKEKTNDNKNNNKETPNIDINKLNPIYLIEELSNNSYSDWGLDNVFTAFISTDKIPYLIYSTKEKDLIFYNLDLKKIMNITKKFHANFITNINHFYDKEENTDIIMTVSAEDNNIKLWDLNNFRIILDIKNVNKQGNLLSACFLNYNNNKYIVVSNGDLTGKEFEPIKLYDFKGKKFLEIKNSNYNTNFITTFYEKETKNNYIITGNDGFVNSYEINENSQPNQFNEPLSKKSHRSVVVIYSEAIKELIATSDDGSIRIWNFNTRELIKMINIGNDPLRGICVLDEKYIFIGSKDKSIKLIDIDEGKIIKSEEKHNNTVLAMKMINLDKYGNCLISQGMGNDHINLWGINYIIKN